MAKSRPAAELSKLDASGLSPLARMAAFFDAMGRTRDEISRLTGLDNATISRWRARDGYKGEVARWRDQHLGDVLDLTRRVRLELLDAGIKATRELSNALEAELADGSPNWRVRLAAADRLVAEVQRLVSQAEQGDSGRTSGATVTLVIRQEGDVVTIDEADVAETTER